MATLLRFEDVEAWQKARELTKEIYACSGNGDFSKDFGLRDQIRRASVSIMANIAEGFDRGGTKELSNFLSIAKGSVGEVEAQLYVALDQEYISNEQFENLFAMTSSTKKLISGFMNYLKQTSIKGIKFKRTSKR
jgi:four helix bundle protein